MRPILVRVLKRHQSTLTRPSSASEDLNTLRAALRGTVPAHQALLLLHTKTPPDQWPTDVSKISPLLREIQTHLKEFNGKALMCYPGDETLVSNATHLMTKGQSKDYRHYTATFFTKLTPPFDIPILNKELLPQFLRFFNARMQTGVNVASVLPNTLQARSLLRSSLLSQQVDRKKVKKTWILICTHGARDCRCGERGSVVAQLMREYVRARPGLSTQVVVGEVSHVGGHRYAPNILVYPQGEWYGTLQPEQVDDFMDSLLDEGEMEETLTGPSSPLWRGSWLDHSGVPTRTPAKSQTELTDEEEKRATSRNRLESMRDDTEVNVGPEWGTDLDQLGKGG